MNIFYRNRLHFVLLALTISASSGFGQAQPIVPLEVPVPDQNQLVTDQQKVQNLRIYAANYNLQVSDYIRQMDGKLAEINAQEQIYIKQSQLLEKKIHDNPRHSSTEKAELSDLRAKIDAQVLLKYQAAQNITTSLGWENYVRAQVNNAQSNVTDDQQQLVDAAQRAQIELEEQQERVGLQQMANQNALNGSYPGDYYDYGYGNIMPYYPLYGYGNAYYNGHYYHDGYRDYHGGYRGGYGGAGVRANGGGNFRGGGGVGTGSGGGHAGGGVGTGSGGGHAGGGGGGARGGGGGSGKR